MLDSSALDCTASSQGGPGWSTDSTLTVGISKIRSPFVCEEFVEIGRSNFGVVVVSREFILNESNGIISLLVCN